MGGQREKLLSWNAPQKPVSQGKWEVLGDWPGQRSQLPPPTAGIAPS